MLTTETHARKIASEWHGGQSTYLYQFASSGSIDADRNIEEDASPLLLEIHDEIRNMRRMIESSNRYQDIEYYEFEERRLLLLYGYIGERYANGEV